MAFNTFEMVTTRSVAKAVKHIQEAFQKKRELEKVIARLIKDYEEETGLAIDMIRYQRDITLPVQKYKYTDLSIIITSEEDIYSERKSDAKEG